MLEQEYTSEKSYKLIDLSLISSNGNLTNIYPSLVELSIFEDVYSSTISGHALISDGNDLIVGMPISGFEFLKVVLGKPGSSATTFYSKTFRVYKIQSQEISLASNSSHSYMIYFCSEENILSQSKKVSKSYKGKESEFIVKDILERYLKTDKIKVESGLGLYDIIIPFLNPLIALTWLTGRVLSKEGSRPDFLFFENKDGYNFVSLSTLFKQQSKGLYSYDVKNVDLKTDTTETEIKDVIKYDFVSFFDVLNNITTGMYSSLLKTVDLVRLRMQDITFSYDKYFQATSHIDTSNPNSFIPEYKDRFNKMLHENHSAHVKMYPTTKDHDIVSSIASRQPGIKPNLVERWMLQRVSQIKQLNYFRLRLVIPGDINLTVGDIIEFNVPITSRKNPGESNNNSYYSGRYLITAIRHKIDLQSYEMIAEVTRDCLSDKYPSVSYNDVTIEAAGRQ